MQELAYACRASNKAGNSHCPKTMGALENSESEDNIIILFLRAGSSRLPGYHGIWTQHYGPHLSGEKHQSPAVREPASSTDS